MRTAAPTYRPYEANPTPYLAFLSIAVGLFISAPAVIGGIALSRVARVMRLEFALLSLLGLAWTFMGWNSIDEEMRRAVQVISIGADHGHWQHGLEAAWPHIWRWWWYASPLGFVLALAIGLLQRRSVDELPSARPTGRSGPPNDAGRSTRRSTSADMSRWTTSCRTAATASSCPCRG